MLTTSTTEYRLLKGVIMTKKEAYEKLLKHIKEIESYDEYMDLLECLYVLIEKGGVKNA